jgi:hypothetical protein
MNYELLCKLQEEDTRGTLGLFDIEDLAVRLDRAYGQYFKEEPENRLYLDFVPIPVIDLDKYKYFISIDKVARNSYPKGRIQTLHTLEEIMAAKSDIWMNHESLVPRMVLGARDIPKLRKVSSGAPIRMLDFITEYVQDYALGRIPEFQKDRSTKWRAQRFDVILQHNLSDAFFEQLKQQDNATKAEFYGEIFYMVEPLMADVREYMGPNQWMVFKVWRASCDLHIRSYVDYRIYAYHDRLEKLLEQERDERERGLM